VTERSIIVCADDAGWCESGDEVIRSLAQSQRISAISVLVDAPVAHQWKSFDAGQGCAVGLHLNLTWDRVTGSNGLAPLIFRAATRRLDLSWVAQKISEQILSFETRLGRAPDFIDGHQHVHVLSGIRTCLLDALDARYSRHARPAIRLPWARRWRGSKAALINILGASRLKNELRRQDWPMNRDFAGVYDLNDATSYRSNMQRWLAQVDDRGLIMTHPGTDEMREHPDTRVEEARYLGSQAWIDDLDASHAGLMPFTVQALDPRRA